MKDAQAGVATSDRTIRMTDSICRALDNARVEEITATVLTDSTNILIELWGEEGRVVGQFIVAGPASDRLRRRVKSTARRASIL